MLAFTGPLGRGCTYVAQGIAEQRGFFYYSLSKPLHEEAKARKGRRKVPFSVLQDIGNELRRREGPGYLAGVALEEAGMALQKNQGEYKGVVLDGGRYGRVRVAAREH